MGYQLHPEKWSLQKLDLLELPERPSLNELQKLVGLRNWLTQAVPGIKTKPFTLMMRGDEELNSKREWTPEARQELQNIRKLLKEHKALAFWEPSEEVYGTVMISGNTLNCKVLQGNNILWIGRIEFPRVIAASPLNRAIRCLHKVRQESIIRLGREPIYRLPIKKGDLDIIILEDPYLHWVPQIECMHAPIIQESFKQSTG